MGDVLIDGQRDRDRSIHLVATAGPGQGRGHLSRAITVAAALRERGIPVSLELDAGGLDAGLEAVVSGLGVRRTTRPPDDAVVVVDMPDVSAASGRAPADRLVVFDDRGAFNGRAAIVIQPSLPTWEGTGSVDRVLAGFDYAPVAASYRALRDAADRTGSHGEPGRREVVICFGGSDPFDVTRRIARAVTAGVGWRTWIVVGPDYRPEVEDLADYVLRDPPDLPERLAACDLAVIGAGTMKFEVACLGRPALLLAAADDQLPVGPAFAASGAARWLGDGRSIDPERVERAVASLISDPTELAAIGSRARAVIDGQGADRIAEALAVLAG